MRPLYMERRSFLYSVGIISAIGLAGCSGGSDSGDADETESDESDSNEESAQASVVWNYMEYDEVRFPHQSEGVYFSSDSETQYVGAQLEITNKINESQSFADGVATGVTLVADDNSGDVTIHGQSVTSPLENVDAGETVEATLLYTAPPQTSSYTLETTEWGTVDTYDITRDESLEIDLIDTSSSGM